MQVQYTLFFPKFLGQTLAVLQKKTLIYFVSLPYMVNSVLQRKHLEENVSTSLIPFFENIITLKNDNNVNHQNHQAESQ